MAKVSLTHATRELAARDPVLARMIQDHGPVRFGNRDPHGPFASLCRAIIAQQLASKVAAIIAARFRALVRDAPTPEAVAALTIADLRAVGLSGTKSSYLKDLAAHVLDGRVKFDGVHRLPDDAIVDHLVAVKGIGRWTAEMFLIFQLRRLDVWPVADLGVQKGFQKAFGLRTLPKRKRLMKLGEKYKPYRSIVAWYCWRETEKR